MIFATVGTQIPFPRMIESVRYAAERLDIDIVAQTIDVDYVYTPKGRLTCVKTVHPRKFQDLVAAADIIVSHAGIGSIISAATASKPIILMPRQSQLSEHRNDHQVDTAKRFGSRRGIYIFNDGPELVDVLTAPLVPLAPIEPDMSPLITGIKSFIWNAS